MTIQPVLELKALSKSFGGLRAVRGGGALGMARTFQVTSLFPRLTVLDNVLLAIEGLRRTKFVMWRPLTSYRDVQEKAHRLLADAGFLDRRDVEIRYLSHGEQRQLETM